MNPVEFLRQLEDDKIVTAIGHAERRTSGEIRVYISHLYRENVLEAARVRFAKMGMHQTRERNAVLIYFVPRHRTFAIVGDAGMHAKCGDSFWGDIAARLGSDLKKKRASEAIVQAIHRIGEALAEHFPVSSSDQNELPNTVERG